MDRRQNIKIKSSTKKKHDEQDTFKRVLSEKIITIKSIITRTILSAQKYKLYDIFGANELNVCLHSLEGMFTDLQDILIQLDNNNKIDETIYINKLQDITNELSSLFRTFGTETIDDLLSICFGADFISKSFITDESINRYNIMKKHVHPIGYKIMSWKVDKKDGLPKNPDGKLLKKNRIVEDFMIVESSDNLDCFDLARTSKAFLTKVYGIKFCIQHPEQKRTLIVCGLVDDIMLSCLDYPFIKRKMTSLEELKPGELDFQDNTFKRFLNCLTLKEILVYDNSELYNRFMGYMNQIHLIKQKTISQITKEFVGNELYGQRTTLIQLLLKSDEHEYQYLAYLLYDLLSNDNNGAIDTHEQTLLFDSLPWNVKKYFRDAMRQTITYTNNLANFDNAKIPLEQQICLMKASDNVKEKAMQKLKEVKSKSDDSGAKVRQYLEGLLKIPFGIYKEEPILKVMNECIVSFNDLMKNLNSTNFSITSFDNKDNYTSMEVRKYINVIKNEHKKNIENQLVSIIKESLTNVKRNILITNICALNNIIRKYNIQTSRLCHSGKKTDYMKENICKFINTIKHNNDLLVECAISCGVYKDEQNIISILSTSVTEIEEKTVQINDYMKDVTKTLDLAVHGHDKAKRQIERIIGQWINGEKSGYCFGFEGPPGLGKTSIAKKGIANCLKDENGNPRPFSFIAVGGSSNGSTLDGHNYTYVGSTWGRIVEILMDKKCMNPIIFIDELDKVSKTEHGKEIIGILTHLIDPTQNDVFEDKYFSGIDLDLSKALFIFSYNDVDAIDRVLLDRIHRIKFKHLSLEDKLVIVKDFLFPEIYKKMGLEGMIEISEDTVKYVIDEYTSEPGVRKLKEILFEIVGEINLEILRNKADYEIPIIITKDDIKYKYLKERHEMTPKKVHECPMIGIISGLWANAMGRGGILPVEAKYYPSGTFLDMKLTGMQGDVMKESMTVAKTLAWSLLTDSEAEALAKSMDETKRQGIHIHVPEGATPKDGPSGGTAITIALYSLFSKRQIRSDVAITGEICLQGKVTAIGGLDLKILGGIKAGVKTFLFPKENKKDYDDFIEKYENNDMISGIKFISIDNINDAIDKAIL
tara:strand:+ start:13671 stop:16967 length:3297 start_codon:yes stop_codon:yes gene_type:complete